MLRRVRTRLLVVAFGAALVAIGVLVAPNALGSRDADPVAQPHQGCNTAGVAGSNCVEYGPAVPLGDGELRAFGATKHGRITLIGLSYSEKSLTNLPSTMSDRERCFDVNGDGSINEHMECTGGHQREVQLPKNIAGLRGSPFEWIMVNWNMMGHGPPMVYDQPHFDVHFYLRPQAEVEAIRLGPCGNVVHCDDFATGRVPVPVEYNPVDYADYGFVQGQMGNHLVDKTSDEWTGGEFDRTFVYGSFNGEITYLEPMITKSWIDGLATGGESGCFPIKQPQKWQVAGSYPQEYCGRYDKRRKEYQISLQDLRPSDH